jgi:hypothetical protein
VCLCRSPARPAGIGSKALIKLDNVERNKFTLVWGRLILTLGDNGSPDGCSGHPARSRRSGRPDDADEVVSGTAADHSCSAMIRVAVQASASCEAETASLSAAAIAIPEYAEFQMRLIRS